MQIPSYTLQTGDEMPALGLGTWQLTGRDCEPAVRMALGMGYPAVDTADAYGNHEQIAPAIADFDRPSYFLTSKVNRGTLSYDDVLATCERNLSELGVDRLDLYLIHWPDPDVPMAETFRALARLVDEGMTRNIGVSNFMLEHLQEALAVAEVPICNNQIKLHPLHYTRQVVDFCQERGIVVTAYSPLGRGEVFGDRTLQAIGTAHGRSAAQVALRWLLHKGLVVIPKASSEAHLRANMEIFDFELSDDQIAAIDALSK